MVVAVVSVPACVKVESSQLEQLKEQGAVDNYEVSADTTLITLYWTYLKTNDAKQVSLSRVVTYGGLKSACMERASQAFLYYADD